MPTYQYACTACGEPLEAVQSFTDPALTECPACGGALRKVYSAVGVVFKGSGFYKNDSRPSSTSGGEKKSDTPAKTDAPEKTAAKTDAAPAKSESKPASTTSTPTSKTA